MNMLLISCPSSPILNLTRAHPEALRETNEFTIPRGPRILPIFVYTVPDGDSPATHVTVVEVVYLLCGL